MKTETEKLLPLNISRKILYVVPQKIDTEAEGSIIFYFRASEEMQNVTVSLKVCFEDSPEAESKTGSKTVFERKYEELKPPEMERFILPCEKLRGAKKLEIVLSESSTENKGVNNGN